MKMTQKKAITTMCVVAMTVLPLFFVTITIAGPPLQSNSVKPAHLSTTEYVKDTILVRFKPEAVEDKVVAPNVAAATHAKTGATVIEEYKAVPGLQLVTLPEGVTVSDAIATYRQDPKVLYAEPDYVRRAEVLPNDPGFKYQWGLHNTGQRVAGVIGTPGADIKAPEAWDATIGSSDVVIAVLDTGIDYNEPDLAPNIVNGWDFVTHNNDPMDRDGHGTHVAGIIAAAGNNGIGVTGVMWKAKIMPLRVNGPDGVSVSDEIAAISYADSLGARIINMSFGGSEYSQAEKDAIDASPAICICSAGNDGTDTDLTPQYPSSYTSSNIIAVAATDQDNTLASFSNYGARSVHVAAPGDNILSTYPPFTQAFTDSFEDLKAWNSQGWRITGAESPSATTSSPGGRVVNTSLTLKTPLDLTSKCGTTLSFDMGLNTVKNHDLFYIEASKDGITWDTIDTWWGTTNGWTSESYSLTGYDTSPYFKIRFGLITDGKAGPSSVYIDNVKIVAFDPLSAQQSYFFDSGTSMAAPYVTGIAGLVKSMHPRYTNLEIKDVILKSVDVKRSLYGGLISTEGIVNASKAASAVPA